MLKTVYTTDERELILNLKSIHEKHYVHIVNIYAVSAAGFDHALSATSYPNGITTFILKGIMPLTAMKLKFGIIF